MALGAILFIITLGWGGVLSPERINVDQVQTAAEEGLIEMLVKQKDAVEKDTTVEVSQAHTIKLQTLTRRAD